MGLPGAKAATFRHRPSGAPLRRSSKRSRTKANTSCAREPDHPTVTTTRVAFDVALGPRRAPARAFDLEDDGVVGGEDGASAGSAGATGAS